MEPKWSIVPCERTDLVAALSPQGLRLKCAQELGAGDMCLSKLQEIVKDREAWHAASMGLQRV